MKTLAGSLVAVALFAAPTFAELSLAGKTIPKGSYSLQPYLGEVDPPGGARSGDPASHGDIYHAGLGFSGHVPYYVNNGGKFVGDDLHMMGTTVTAFRWLYADAGTASHSSSLAFFFNTAGDAGPLFGNTATFVSGTMVYGAVFNVTGLPQATLGNPNGRWIVSVNLPPLLTGLDAWVGLKSTSTTPTGPLPAPGIRPGLAGASFVYLGHGHDLHWSGFFPSPNTTMFFGMDGFASGNFKMTVRGMPEPAAAALLAIGGLLALRRRTRAARQ